MIATGLAAGSALAPILSHGQPALGRTGQRLPAIGLALTDLDRSPIGQHTYLQRLLTAFREAGGRVVDTSGLSEAGELAFGQVVTGLGLAGELFVIQKLRSSGDDALRQLRRGAARLGRDRADVVQVDDLTDAEVAVPMLQRWKEAGAVGQVAVGHDDPRYFPAIEILLRNAAVDVVRVRYSLLTRSAEEHLLPLAAERGVGVIAGRPAEDGRLHRLTAGRRPPAWAAEFGAATWAQFFLKYVLGHPAVTVVTTAAGSPAQVTESMRALHGPRPDGEQRARMAEHLADLSDHFADR